MIGLMLPYITSATLGMVPDEMTINAGLSVIANIVVGIGFLGAGLIIKTNDHPHGVTTAALVWATAAIGILAGIGMLQFATVAAFLMALLLYILRKLNIANELKGSAQPIAKKRTVRK